MADIYINGIKAYFSNKDINIIIHGEDSVSFERAKEGVKLYVNNPFIESESDD